jgi:MGT family glycosyltransferase
MPPSTRPIRPDAADDTLASVPAWVAERERPRVCVTMGTMPIAIQAVLPWIAGAFDGLDVEVVLTIGERTDPAMLGTPPANVRIAPYVPMSRLLPTCDALVFHAGSGTMLAALAAGVPMVLLPVAADQPANAERCEAAGVGVAIPADRQDAAAVRDAVGRVMTDDRFRLAAARVRDEVAAMPDPASVVPDLEAIVARRD